MKNERDRDRQRQSYLILVEFLSLVDLNKVLFIRRNHKLTIKYRKHKSSMFISLCRLFSACKIAGTNHYRYGKPREMVHTVVTLAMSATDSRAILLEVCLNSDYSKPHMPIRNVDKCSNNHN